MFGGGEHSLEPLTARPRSRFTRSIPWGHLLVPGTLVQGPDRLLHLRISDYQKAPPLHISATWGTDARLEDFSDQFIRHGISFQPPHRAAGPDNLEQVGAVCFVGHAVLGGA